MLLTQMVSDEQGHLFGQVIPGEDIPLSVPHASAEVGKARFEEGIDYAMNEAAGSLQQRALIDTGRYYCICTGEHRENNTLFVIPYLTFDK